MNNFPLIIRDLHYTYPRGSEVLRGVNLTLERDMRLALVGKNGSGKSTLLSHIPGLLSGPGHIEVEGTVRQRKTMGKIRSMVGFLFSQSDYHFIMPTLLSDIMLSVPGGDKEHSLEKATALMEKLGLRGYEKSNPLELSSGEMKRAALGGVLAKEPKLLLLDEPLNNLDRPGALALTEILVSLSLPMVIATHHLMAVKSLATHVAVMDEGRVGPLYPLNQALEREEVQNLLL